MAQIEGIQIKNFRSLRDVTLGSFDPNRSNDTLTPITAVIGKNGVGKTSLFDTFGYISDCMNSDVEVAAEKPSRGGFQKLRTQGVTEPMMFSISYRDYPESLPIGYYLEIDANENGRPFVKREILLQANMEQKGIANYFLILENGKGSAYKGQIDILNPTIKTSEVEQINLANPRSLGIATLGSLQDYPGIVSFRNFINNWYLSYFTPNAARIQPPAGAQPRLNVQGDNLANVIQYLERDHRQVFKKILKDISKKIPGISKITSKRLEDGKLLLCFNDKAFVDPFYSFQISDGTLKLLAYLILLNDPNPPSFMGIEEPENGLYPELLAILVREFRQHTERSGENSQIFLTTHQPLILDALTADEVWIMTKDKDGYSHLRRASSDPIVKELNKETFPMGQMWSSSYLD